MMILIRKKKIKIRRILLLKIDRELKTDSNNHLNIMINSKKPQEMNKAYNSYKILLSETTRVYSNYVEIIEKCYPNNKKEIKRKKESPRNNKEEQIIMNGLAKSVEKRDIKIGLVH